MDRTWKPYDDCLYCGNIHSKVRPRHLGIITFAKRQCPHAVVPRVVSSPITFAFLLAFPMFLASANTRPDAFPELLRILT
jgi:hypothetical protein